MAIYEYLCPEHGVFEAHAPIGSARAELPCPACGAGAPRIVSAPQVLGTRRSAWSDAIERSLRSAHEPDVVSRIPAAGQRPRVRTVPMTPTLAGLPRPGR